MIKKENKRTTITLTTEGQRALKEIDETLNNVNKELNEKEIKTNTSKIINLALVYYCKMLKNAYQKITF